MGSSRINFKRFNIKLKRSIIRQRMTHCNALHLYIDGTCKTTITAILVKEDEKVAFLDRLL